MSGKCKVFGTQFFFGNQILFELQQFGTHNFLCSKIFQDLNFLEPKFFRIQIFFGTQNYFRPQKYSGPNILILKVQLFKKKIGTNNLIGKTFFGNQHFPNPNFRDTKFLSPKTFETQTQNFSSPKIFWNQSTKTFLIQHFF